MTPNQWHSQPTAAGPASLAAVPSVSVFTNVLLPTSPRDITSRVFLALVQKCTPNERDEFEEFIEASIIFGRSALHHLEARFKNHQAWAA